MTEQQTMGEVMTPDFKQDKSQEPSMSVTGVMDFCQSPAHYKAFQIDKLREPTKAMDEGTVLHWAIFEPEKFAENVVLQNQVPEDVTIIKTIDDMKNFLTDSEVEFKKSGQKKDYYEQLVKKEVEKQGIEDIWFPEDLEKYYEGKIVFTDSQMKTCELMRESVINTKYFKNNFGKGDVELKLEGEIDGVKIRGRLDWLHYKENLGYYVIMDLKKTRSAHRKKFSSIIGQSFYHVQAWLYSELVKQNFGKDAVYAWLPVEGSLPHICQPYAADDGLLDAAETLVRLKLKEFKNCLKTDTWNGYTDGRIENISLPQWSFDEVAELEERTGASYDSMEQL